MKKILITLLIFLAIIPTIVFTQIKVGPILINQINPAHLPGTPCHNCPWADTTDILNLRPIGNSTNNVMNGNGVIATNYTQTACGLGYTQVSARLHKRVFSGVPPGTGTTQPCPIVVSGIPAGAIIQAAFLYAGGSGPTGSGNFNATLVNPSAVSQVFTMTQIGFHIDKCWGYGGTWTSRANVTAVIIGNGTYTLSGCPVMPQSPSKDTDGATLFIVYVDPALNITGSIVIADGCQVGVGGTINSLISGFNVCGNPTTTQNFMLIGDLQRISSPNLRMNSLINNAGFPIASQQIWDYIPALGAPAVNGQTTANYGVTSTGDCYSLNMAGMFWQTGPCLTVTALSTPSCPTSNATVTVLGGNPAYTYTWTPTNQNTQVATGLTSGTYTVNVTDNLGCKTGTAVVSVTTTPLNPITITNGTICSGNTSTLTANGAPTYTWAPPATLNTISGPNVIANPIATTIYSVSFTNTAGCVGTQTTQVTVNPTPTITSVSNTGPVCQGSPVSLSVTTSVAGTTSYSWFGPNGFNSNAATPLIASPVPNNTGTYSVTVVNTFTNGGVCISTSNSNLVIVPITQVSVISTYTQCQGTNINLNAFVNGATSYTWNGPNSYTSGLSNPTLLNSTPAISGNYTVTAYFASNQTTLVCTSTAVSNVSIVPTNPVSISPAQNVCQGSNNIILTASASANTTYNWFGPNNFNMQQQTIPFNNIQPFVSGNYVVNAVWSIGTVSCTTSNTTNLSVVPVNTVTVVPQLNVCENDNAILTSTAQGATSYTWTGPNGFNVNQPVTYFQNLNPNWNGVYTVTASFTNGNLICFSSNQTVLQVKPKINFSLTPIGKLCYNQPLNVNGPNGATSYSWVGPGFTSSLQNLSLPNTTTANIGTYSLTVDLNGCKTYGSIFVDVQTPISWGNIVQPQPLCKGQTFTISAQAQGGSGNYAYNWNPVTYILGPNGDTQTGVAVSTTIYNIDVFDIACPYYKIYNTIVLNVNQPPIPKLTVPNYSCEPYCQIFNSKVNYEAATVLYTFNGSKQVMGDSVKVCLSSGLYNVNVTTFGLNGCKGSFDYPKLITVYPKPEADFTWSPQEPNTVSENFVTFYPKEQNNESYYSWFLSETDTSNSLIPSRYFYEPGKYPISLLLTNKFGCKDTATKVIEIVEEELFFLPNSFTPNGDGSNDVFAPKGLGFKSYTLAIFDRWGQVILSPSNNSQGWDGKFKGDICQDGVYVYQVTVLDKDGKRHTRTGHVTLMK